MKLLRNRYWLVLVTAIAFFAFQTISVTHAAEFGDRPHLHHGQVCALSVVADRDGPAILPDCALVFAPVENWVAFTAVSDGERAAISRHVPAIRGPPSL